MATKRPAVLGNGVASLAVAAVVAGFGLGLPAVNRSVSGLRALPTGVPYRVSDAVTVVPPIGARLDAGLTRPARDGSGGIGTVYFVRGAVRMQVTVRTASESPPDPDAGLREKIRRTPGLRLIADGAGESAPDALDGEAAASAGRSIGRYVGRGIEGRYRAASCGRVVAEATVHGPAADMADQADAIRASLASLTCRLPP
jgi:hypothetical protein